MTDDENIQNTGTEPTTEDNTTGTEPTTENTGNDQNDDNTQNNDGENTEIPPNTPQDENDLAIELFSGRYPIYLNTVKILDKIDVLEQKIDALTEIVTENNTLIKYLQEALEFLQPSTPDSEDTIKQQVIDKLINGARFNEILDDLKSMLIIEGIYDSRYVLLKLYTDHKTQDTILVVKLRPNPNMGKIITFFYEEFGEPYRFITSDYKMRIILKYKLIKHMQMDEMTSDSSIIDKVNRDWGDKDDVNKYLG